jgi:hypothetical protein
MIPGRSATDQALTPGDGDTQARSIDTEKAMKTSQKVLKVSLGWVGGAVLAAMTTVVVGAQHDADMLLSVDLTPDLKGLSLDDVQRGEFRVRWTDEGPRMTLDALRLDPAKLDAPSSRSVIPSVDSGCLIVTNFEFSTRNRLGGTFFSFDQEPSSARAELAQSSDGQRVLQFEYLRENTGFAGLSIHLHDPEPLENTEYYLDGRGFETLSFRVRGSLGRERIAVRMSDDGWNERDTAETLGTLADFIDSGRVTLGWQRAVIDLDGLPRALDRSRLDKLVLLPAEPHAGGIEIDDLQLCKSGQVPSTENRPTPPSVIRKEQRALWVWKTSDLLANEDAASDFLAFLPEQGIDTVYLQLPTSLIAPVDEFDPETDARDLRGLLRQLSNVGVRALALDGAAHYALPEHHGVVEGTIHNVARYNAAVEPVERFVGLHYDVEPYLLDDYDGAARWPILRGYLRLLERAHALSQAADLSFEVAIPFWFDSIVIPPVPEDDMVVLKPLSEEVIDRTDSIALMDYRTVSDGSNGTKSLGESELLYASQRGRGVVLGLETTMLPDRDVYRFYGLGEPGLPETPGDSAWVVAVGWHEETSGYLVRGDGVRRLRESLASRGTSNSETSPIRHWEVGVQIPVAASQITFYDLGPSALHKVIDETRAWARRYPAYGGMAVHYYESYRRLLEVGDPDAVPDSPVGSGR